VEPAAANSRLRETLTRLWNELEAQAAESGTYALLTAEVFLELENGPLRVGLEGSGERHILVPVRAETPTTVDRSSAGVHLDVRDLVLEDVPVRFADLTCRRTDLSAAFAGLAADICERLARSPREPLATVTRALGEWRALLGAARHTWTVETVIGLFGELLVLRDVLDIAADAASLWTGPHRAPHDFHSVHHAIEVKTTARATGRLIRVHGSDQLERPVKGRLDLCWYRITESPNGVTPAALLEQCLALSADPAVILSALDALHAPPPEHRLMSELRLEPIETRCYGVGDAFPRITPEVFAVGAVPAGVSAIEYTLDLDTIAEWNNTGTEALQRLVADR
jgi:hypothetical protein